jgi:lipoprotein-anchoring transpeptidase ErfK/SrfK
VRRAAAWKVWAAVAAAAAVAGLVTSAVLTPGLPKEGGTGVPVAAATSPVVPVVPKPVVHLPSGPPLALIATLSGATAYTTAPGEAPSGSLAATNPFGQKQVLAVIDRVPGWLEVELPVRPNGSEGWIPAATASLTETSYRVAINLESRVLTVSDAGRMVLSTPVAVGQPSTPTPAGHTYLWELIRPDNPYGAYGPYIFGLAWFSDAYSVFNGGDAQIGIHGQDEPWSIGQAASHGCVRLPNDVISRLASLLPLGTPVTIA